jgi:AmiR/NasT family two-component response regulator
MKDSFLTFPDLISEEFAMTVTQIRDEGQTLRAPRGKVVATADTRAVFDEVAQALQAAGFEKIEALSGQEGINLLERIHTFFFSDMEDRMLTHHIEDLKADHIIMLIETPTDRVDEAVRIASGRGAHCLVHFGLATVTWLTK